MLFKSRIIIFLFSVTILPQMATAAFSCDVIHSQTADAYAQKLGIEKGKDFWSRFLYKKYLRIWDSEKTYNQTSFERAIVRSHFILEKLRLRQGLIADRNFSQEEVIRWAEKTLMKEGLKGYFEKTLSQGIRRAWPKRVYNQIERILTFKSILFLWHTYSLTLPNRVDKEMPKELLAKILIDGIDPHLSEIQNFYKKTGQSKMETYRQVQAQVKYLSLALSALIGFNHFENFIVKQEQTTKIQITAQLKSVEDGLDKIEQMLDAGQFDD